jgi:hypothetical protein
MFDADSVKCFEEVCGKSETRRVGWKGKHVSKFVKRVGSWVRASSGRANHTHFGWVYLRAMYQQRLGDMTEADVLKEGFPGWTVKQFRELACFEGTNDDTMCWVIQFRFLYC